MSEERPTADRALLAAGWEFGTETGLYRSRSPGGQWLTYEEARARQFGPPAAPAPEPPAEPTIPELLTAILDTLKRIERKLGGSALQ